MRLQRRKRKKLWNSANSYLSPFHPPAGGTAEASEFRRTPLSHPSTTLRIDPEFIERVKLGFACVVLHCVQDKLPEEDLINLDCRGVYPELARGYGLWIS